MTKDELRSHFRNIRQEFVSKQDSSSIITAINAARGHLERGLPLPQTVAGYAAYGAELDPLPLLEAWRGDGRTIALPRFAARGSPMEFRQWTGDLVIGPMMGIPQPRADSPPLDPELVLVPLTAVDLAGNRIGQGGGHYDRKLAELRARGPVTAIGFCWECQIAEALPADPWDQPLDHIVTPERLIAVAS